MKVLVLVNGLTHYYNLILNKLNSEPDVDIVVVAPREPARNIGAGVHQTREGIAFRVIDAKEQCLPPVCCTFRGLAHILRQERPDIAIVPDVYIAAFYLLPRLRLSCRVLGIKLVMQSIPFGLRPYSEALAACERQSNLLDSWPRAVGLTIRSLRLEKWLRRAYLELRRRVFLLADAHLNYVEDGRAIYASYGVAGERIFVTANSPDTDLLREMEETLPASEHPAHPRRLVHVGRLVDWKRVDLLIRALARVRKAYPDSELLVIGSGPEGDRLERLAEGLGVGAAVHFVGAVHEPRVLARYLRSSGVYVLAGMGGLSINDAMFNGLPVVCSVCDGTEKRLVRDGYNGLFFAEGSEDDLVDKLLTLFRQPELCRQMGKHSRRIIDDEVNVHTVLAGYLDAFRFVCEAGR